MPNRIIKESLCTNDSINSLSWAAEVLFYRLIVLCNEHGEYDARPQVIRGHALPLKDIEISDVEKLIYELENSGLIDVKGSKLYVSDWDDMQPEAGRKTQEYKSWRQKVFQRDNYTCQMCGAVGGKLEAHHINRYRNAPNERTLVSNGITLCKACHKALHSKEGK